MARIFGLAQNVCLDRSALRYQLPGGLFVQDGPIPVLGYRESEIVIPLGNGWESAFERRELPIPVGCEVEKNLRHTSPQEVKRGLWTLRRHR